MLRGVVDVTVVVPSIPTRSTYRHRALQSVYNQTVVPVSINVHEDVDKLGAAKNRDLAVGHANTEWLAFLDDDDELEPDHLKLLLEHARQAEADLVYPWFTVIGGSDPFPMFEGRAWDDDEPHQIPITFLVKTSVFRAVGGFSEGWDPSMSEDPGTDEYGNRAGEDYRFVLRVVDKGFKISHLNKRTWKWHHHASNTSGLPSRW